MSLIFFVPRITYHRCYASEHAWARWLTAHSPLFRQADGSRNSHKINLCESPVLSTTRVYLCRDIMITQ